MYLSHHGNAALHITTQGCIFDLEMVRNRPNKSFCKQWITLIDTTGERQGSQGRVKISVMILEAGDEVPVFGRPKSFVSDHSTSDQSDQSDLQPYYLYINCYVAENLPQDLQNELRTSARWGAKTAEFTSAVKNKKQRIAEGAQKRQIKRLQLQTTLRLIVVIQENDRALPTSDAVYLKLVEQASTTHLP